MRVCVEQSLSLLIWDPETDLQMEKLKEFVIQNEFEELEKEREKKRWKPSCWKVTTTRKAIGKDLRPLTKLQRTIKNIFALGKPSTRSTSLELMP